MTRPGSGTSVRAPTWARRVALAGAFSAALAGALAGACSESSPAPQGASTVAAARGSQAVTHGGGPAFEAARQRAVQLQDSGADQGEVLAALQAAFALDPDHYGINHRLARLDSDLRLHDQALEHFLRAHRARPDDHEVLMAVVTLQVRLGQLDEALANLPPLEADRAYAGDARYQRASILDARGERAAALALVADTKDLPPREAYRCESLHGRYLLEEGDVAGSREHFRKALAGRADYKEALKGLADSCRRLGQDTEAARWDHVLALFLALTDNAFIRSPAEREHRRATLEELVVAYPDWVEGFAQLADLQLDLGDRAAACRTIERFLAGPGANSPPDAVGKLRARYCESGGK